MSEFTVGIAGSGNVGQAVGRLLRERGQCVTRVASRSLAHADLAARFIGTGVQAVSYEEVACDRVIVAVPDGTIVNVTRRLPSPAIVLHTSGAMSGEVLAGLHAGASYGSLHPLQTLPNPESGYRALPGCTFAVDGEPAALAWAMEIVNLLEGMALQIPSESRALYHAAAVMASNHLTATMDAAIESMVRVGIDPKSARAALTNISREALENTLRDGAAKALTGPVARGDAGTVARHIEALKESPATIQELYRAAARHALAIARRRGLPPEVAEAVSAAIGIARG